MVVAGRGANGSVLLCDHAEGEGRYLTTQVAEVSWLALNTIVVMAMLYRLGLNGWQLSVAGTAAIWLVEAT